jgi:hypothetical protein
MSATMNSPLIPILSIPILVFCVAELLLVTRVCSLCKFLITNELLRTESEIIIDNNGKVVAPTEIAVAFINHFPLLSLSFGLCEALWLVSCTVLQ